MSAPWFRLYAEFATDPKIQMMSEADQRRFVMLLCVRCGSGHETLPDDEVTFLLRCSETEWAETKAVFMTRNLIDKNNKIVSWEKRQYLSDSSTERVRKHRNAKKQERSVTVTPPDQIRSDQIQNRTENTKPRDETKKTLPIDVLLQAGVAEQDAKDWLTVRKTKKAPLTAAAWSAMQREAAKAGLHIAQAVRVAAENSWQGFKAEWFANLAPDRRTEHQKREDSTTRALYGDLLPEIIQQAKNSPFNTQQHQHQPTGGYLDGECTRAPGHQQALE